MKQQLTWDVSIFVIPPEAIIGGVQLIPRIGLVDLEIRIVIVRLVLVRVHAHLVRVARERDARVQSDLTILLVVDGAYFESVLVPADEAGLLPAVA